MVRTSNFDYAYQFPVPKPARKRQGVNTEANDGLTKIQYCSLYTRSRG